MSDINSSTPSLATPIVFGLISLFYILSGLVNSDFFTLINQVQLLVSAEDIDNYKQIKEDLDKLRILVEKSELWVYKGRSISPLPVFANRPGVKKRGSKLMLDSQSDQGDKRKLMSESSEAADHDLANLLRMSESSSAQVRTQGVPPDSPF